MATWQAFHFHHPKGCFYFHGRRRTLLDWSVLIETRDDNLLTLIYS